MLKTLLVDDEPYILQGMSKILDWEKEGYEIADTARNGMEALEILNHKEIDLVITDIQMPRMTGLELVQQANILQPDTPYFVILSGYHDFEYARQAMKFSCADYLLKPIDKEELKDVLHRVRQCREKSAPRTSISKRSCDVHEEEEEYLDQPMYEEQDMGVPAQVEKHLWEHYQENLTLKELGRIYYMNAAYLGQVFKKQYGESFKDYLNHIRIEKAKELLLNTNKRIYEIAEEVGYRDVDYFMNKFITQNGCTPTKYRKQMAK